MSSSMYRKRSAFDRYIEEQNNKPSFAVEYKKAVREIKAVDNFIRAINLDGIENGMTIEELARRISNSPAALKLLMACDNYL
jgi:hypothetical protein